MAATGDKHYKFKITSRKEITDDLWSFRIKPDEKMTFEAGQYATLGVDRGDKTVERPYSIVSSPFEDELEFFLELVSEGELTPLLHKLQVGDEGLMRKRCKGRFTLDRKSGHKNPFLASTVTGLAPYVSMARTLDMEEKKGNAPNANLVILQAASHSREFGHYEELKAIADRCDWLEIIGTVSRPWEDKDWNGEVGRVEDVLRKYLDKFNLTAADTTAYLCGNPQMIENSKGIMKRKGFEKDSMKEEVYWVPTVK